jgi:hypothetical protein
MIRAYEKLRDSNIPSWGDTTLLLEAMPPMTDCVIIAPQNANFLRRQPRPLSFLAQRPGLSRRRVAVKKR